IRRLDELTVPVVTAVAGWAPGAGLSLALAADFSVVNAQTLLLAAYLLNGLSPDFGMSWPLPRALCPAAARALLLANQPVGGGMSRRLPRAIGPAAARAFILGNQPVGGEEPHRSGMVTTFVDGEVPGAAEELAARLASGPRAAYAAAKRLIRDSETSTLSEHLDAERDSIAALAAHPDGVEGVDAFIAKRTPRFGAS